jgi:type I restriction enzyme, S subunit
MSPNEALTRKNRIDPALLKAGWNIDALFLLYMFMTRGMQDYLKQLASGSTVEHIPVPDCKTIVIALPPKERQEEYTVVARKVELLRRKQNEAFRQADALFQRLLHDAFTLR